MTFNAQLEKRKRRILNQKNLKFNGLPEQLTDVDELYQAPTDLIKFSNFTVSTDSGAHSLYKEHFVVGDKMTAQARIRADYSYIQTKEFKKFLDSYIAHCHEYKDLYQFYVTLDIINNPEESWRITEYMESEGLSPIPVFHNGEDIKWLERMVEKYPYLGISGLGQDIVKAKFKPFGDACFKVICDKDGKPKCKVHGFALGTPEIIKLYPWYSADQSTWTYMSRVGSLLVPKPILSNLELIGYDYLNLYRVVPVTPRRDVEKTHYDNLGSTAKRFILQYLQSNDIPLEAVRNSYHWRDIANIRLFNNIEKAAKDWYAKQFNYPEGGNVYFAGTAAGAGTNRSRLIKLLHDVKIDSMNWLVTPVYPQHAENVRVLTQARLNETSWNNLWDETQASKARKSTVYVKKKTDKKIVRKELKIQRPPVEAEITVTFIIKKQLDVNLYGTFPLNSIANKITEEVDKLRLPLCENTLPQVKVILKNKIEQVQVDNTDLPLRKDNQYGFF